MLVFVEKELIFSQVQWMMPRTKNPHSHMASHEYHQYMATSMHPKLDNCQVLNIVVVNHIFRQLHLMLSLQDKILDIMLLVQSEY